MSQKTAGSSAPLASGSCQVWWATPGHHRPWHDSLLNPVERTRADAYAQAIDRRRFTVGVAMSRLVLGGLLHLPAAAVPLVRDCDLCGRPHGRPRVPGTGIHLSISHSGDHVVLAVTASGPIGVDVERVNPRAVEMSGSVLTANEQGTLTRLSGTELAAAFFRLWVRKEAALKSAGVGLRVPLTEVDVAGPAGSTSQVTLPARSDPISVADLGTDREHAGALAVNGSEMPSVQTLDAGALLTTDFVSA